MKITRFAQSCLLVETKNKRILIDPGNIFFEESLITDYWQDINILLVTHKHSDHCYLPAIMRIVDNPKTQFYISLGVVQAYKELHLLHPHIVGVWDILKFDGVMVHVVKAVHGFLPHLKGGNEILDGVWYIIDDWEKKLYITGDSLCFSTNDVCDILCVPVCNHGLVMWPFEAALFAKQVQATLVIPIHYDNDKYPIDLDFVEKEFKKQQIIYHILSYKEFIEI